MWVKFDCVSGVPNADQTEANRSTLHGKTVKPNFYQKFILILLSLIVGQD